MCDLTFVPGIAWLVVITNQQVGCCTSADSVFLPDTFLFVYSSHPAFGSAFSITVLVQYARRPSFVAFFFALKSTDHPFLGGVFFSTFAETHGEQCSLGVRLGLNPGSYLHLHLHPQDLARQNLVRRRWKERSKSRCAVLAPSGSITKKTKKNGYVVVVVLLLDLSLAVSNEHSHPPELPSILPCSRIHQWYRQ